MASNARRITASEIIEQRRRPGETFEETAARLRAENEATLRHNERQRSVTALQRLVDRLGFAIVVATFLGCVAAFGLLVAAGVWVVLLVARVLWGMAWSSSGLSGPLF